MSAYRGSRLLKGMVVAVTVFVSACNSPSAPAADTKQDLEQTVSRLKRDDALHGMLPEDIRKAGVITAATAADYPPFEFLDDNGKLIGADIDISAALGTILGVRIVNVRTDFSNIAAGIQAGRFNIGISSIGDYASRRKVVDFVDYYMGGTSFLHMAGKEDPKTIDDVCGTAVGVVKGTSSQTQAEGGSETCVAGGKQPIRVHAFPTQNAAILALTSGRVDFVSGDQATNGYTAKQIGPSLLNGGRSVYGDRPYYGIAVPKDSPLYEPIFKAMAVLMKSGVYAEILKRWGIDDGGMAEPLKNQGKDV